MYYLSITKKRRYKNETSILEYSTLENLLKDLKYLLQNNNISKNDILRIEKGD